MTLRYYFDSGVTLSACRILIRMEKISTFDPSTSYNPENDAERNRKKASEVAFWKLGPGYLW